jgi:GNAT superfamily N-acetyltransferase
MPTINLRFEDATAHDAPLILRFTRALAEYERLSDQLVATEETIRNMLLTDDPRIHVVIAYIGDEPAGIAVWTHNYSTFLGRPGLYLEDLFVLPAWRKRGIGRQLLVHLAGIAVARGCGRMEWSVLDWNEPAIGFYRTLGAEPLEDWTVFRLTGAALAALGQRVL